ncbi:hypothetical protein [Herpetosiphon sp. NSE202]|uniref:hypothetical protein n=1 Tax=Herpetosiphon sp. NSE202 TaxID=3351349 RepID=UPI0036270E01
MGILFGEKKDLYLAQRRREIMAMGYGVLAIGALSKQSVAKITFVVKFLCSMLFALCSGIHPSSLKKTTPALSECQNWGGWPKPN